ncbi:MAG: hypothetical protein ONB24_05780 [candidate division KSB1 bacterium]|nr:hypothetical protein [candidate division KSB1 bacterium]
MEREGEAPMNRAVIHIRVADFPVAVEQALEPRLHGRPTAVAVETAGRALIFAASAEARAAGVFSGMPVPEARRRAPDLILLPPNADLYRRAMEAMLDVVRRYTPVYEPLRFGRAYLDMSGTERLFGRIKDAAADIQKQIRRRLNLGASAGVAGNKLVSRTAAEFVAGLGEPLGLYDVRIGEEAAFLAPLSVRYLAAGRRDVYQELWDLNLRRIRQVAETPVEHLQTVFGRLGVLLHQQANGIDPRPVMPPKQKPEIVEIDQLEEDSNDFPLLRARLHGLLACAARRLRRERLLTARLSVEILYSDQRSETTQQRFSATDDEFALTAELNALLGRAVSRRVRVRRLTLRLGDLTPPPQQLSLFDPARDPKREALIAALDRIRDRYGETAIRFGRAA